MKRYKVDGNKILKTYSKVLLALELDDKVDTYPINHTLELVKECESELYVLHVIEHMGSYGAAYGVAAGADIEAIIHARAKESLDSVCQKLGVDGSHAILRQGSSAHVILEEAENLNVDLIVVGSHAVHGVRLIIGSTADSVITKAKCDVLAVRVAEN